MEFLTPNFFKIEINPSSIGRQEKPRKRPRFPPAAAKKFPKS
jgi:hypothetical protein